MTVIITPQRQQLPRKSLRHSSYFLKCRTPSSLLVRSGLCAFLVVWCFLKAEVTVTIHSDETTAGTASTSASGASASANATIITATSAAVSIPRYAHWKTRKELGVDNKRANSRKGAPAKGPVQVSSSNKRKLKVNPTDYAYRLSTWDSSPIVLPQHKLIFFTVPKVGCSVFKRLFRTMMGLTFEGDLLAEHNPKKNGLTYLSQYPIAQAQQIMNSPEWTRAIFLRDPKERVLSAYMDKALLNNPELQGMCCTNQECAQTAAASFGNFLQLIHVCNDSHWAPFVERMEPQYWPTIDFIGHMNNIQNDTKRLLQQLPPGNVWEQYGATGWGSYKNETIFSSAVAAPHKTGAKNKLLKHYTPETELMAEELYWMDYQTKLFGFENVKLYPQVS